MSEPHSQVDAEELADAIHRISETLRHGKDKPKATLLRLDARAVRDLGAELERRGRALEEILQEIVGARDCMFYRLMARSPKRFLSLELTRIKKIARAALEPKAPHEPSPR